MNFLRISIGVLFWFLGFYKARYSWMSHYLLGRKTNKVIPNKDFDWDVIFYTISRKVREQSGSLQGRRMCVHHSTLYKGAGFWGRPEMFYLVGGFSFEIYLSEDSQQVEIWGEDIYDWHPTEDWYGNPAWFTSPCPAWCLTILRLFVDKKKGNLYFPYKGFPHNKPGISNQFWADLGKVGAKEFKTLIRASMPRKEFGKTLAKYLASK